MLGKRASPVRREAVRKGPFWYLAGGPPYRQSGSDRGPPEKDPNQGHLADGLPVYPRQCQTGRDALGRHIGPGLH